MRFQTIPYAISLLCLSVTLGCGDTEGDTDDWKEEPGDASTEDVDLPQDAGKEATTKADATQEATPAECVDECESVGQTGCHEGGIRTCGQFDSDSCLEWSEVEACSDDLICDPATVTCREPCKDHCDPFSVVFIPDPQNYSNKQPNNASNSYHKQMQWIVDHREKDNIQFAIHLGDITNHNVADEWKVADAAHAILDKKAMPYSITTGNHDYKVGAGWSRGGSLFDDYFGKKRFEGKSWYGGTYGSSAINNHTTFQVGHMKFLVLSVEFAPRKDTICWANKIIANHPDHHVIIATHCYLTHGAGGKTSGAYSGCPDSSYLTLGAAGQSTWDELVSRHSNVFLVASGHINDSEHRVRKGRNGNDVHEMLVDYQMEGPCTEANASSCKNNCRAGGHTGNGWFRKLTFDPRKNMVQAETFTVEDGNKKMFPAGKPVFFCSELFNPGNTTAAGDNNYSSDPSHEDHRFSFTYDMNSPVTYSYDDGGKNKFIDRTVNSASAGDQLVPRAALSPTGNHVIVWQDDSSKDDGDGNHDIHARGFQPGGCGGFADIVVNKTTKGHQKSPAIAMDEKGNFVVAWADNASGVFRVKARGFAPDGKERIPEFAVSTGSAVQQAPDIAMSADGNFVIVWQEGPTPSAQVFMSGYAANGTEKFAKRSVHSDTEGQRIYPAVAMDSASNFVVVWQDDSDSNGSYQIHGRGFDASGQERFARKTINTVAAGQQRNPTIGMSASGAFVVAWADDQAKSGTHQVLARGFASDGTQTIADFRVHEKTAKHSFPRVAMEPNGAFAIVWQVESGAFANQAEARSFKADGSEWRKQWRIHRLESGDQNTPDIALNASGTLVTTWADDMDGNKSMQILSSGVDSP